MRRDYVEEFLNYLNKKEETFIINVISYPKIK